MPDIRTQLSACELFAGLDEPALALLAAAARKLELDPGAALYTAG